MADLSYDVQVNSAQAERNLANLQKSVGTLNTAFVRFRETLATISLGAVITSAVRYADAIQDISDSTGLAIANIVGFSAAVQDNGGSAESAQKAILKFVGAIGEAAAGSSDLQSAFRDVGVSLNDLATLSEQDLLNKTIAGLDKITNASERSVLVTKLLGKEFRNVKFGELGAAYAAATAQNARYSNAISSASAAQGQLEKVIRNFQIALLEVLTPISKFVSQLDVSVETIKQAIITVGQLGLALFALTKGLAIVNRLSNAWATLAVSGKALSHNVHMIGASFFGFFKNIGRAVGVLDTSRTSLQLVGFAVASLVRSILRFAGLAGLIYTVVEAFSYLEKSVFQTNHIEKGVRGIAIGLEYLTRAAGGLLNLPGDLLGKIFFGGKVGGDAGKPLIALAEEAEAARKAAEDGRAGMRGRGDPDEIANREKAAADEKKRLREVAEALAKRRAEIQKASQAFKDQNNQIFENLNLEKSLIGKSEDFIEVERAREEVLKRAADESAKLQEAKKALTKDEQSLSAVYDQQIAKIHAVAQVDADRIAKNIEGLQGLRMVEKARLQDIENTTKALEDQFARQQQLNDTLSDVGQQQLDVKGQRTVGETAGLSTIQKQLLEIQDRAKSAAQEAGRAFAANFEGEDGLTPERAEELARGLDQISGAFARLTLDQEAFAQRNYDSSRTFQAGWDEAFTRFAESTTNTAEQTAQYFDKLTNGMADAFGKMAESGKWSFSELKNNFKDLANSMIADFIRIMAKRAILGMMGGSGGFLSSLFGRANGGDVSGETPYIVGERGPELFIPKSAGTIVSNSQLNSTGSGNREPASVTYNISAVDASSFRSLVARDPSFIYAITEKGRQSQPRARMA